MPLAADLPSLRAFPCKASIIKKHNGTETYYVAVSARVNGKPRIVSQTYLGTADRLAKPVQPEDWIACAQMSMTQHIEPGDSGGAVLMRDGEDWVLVGTTFYSYGAGGQLAAQRTSYYLSWIAQYVGDGPDGPGTSPSPQAVEVALGSSGSTITLMMTEAGGFTLGGETFAGGEVYAENGNTYTLTMADGKWSATFVPVVAEVALGTSGDMLTVTMLEDRTYETGGEPLREGDTRAARNGNVYRLSMVNGTWTAVLVSDPPSSTENLGEVRLQNRTNVPCRVTYVLDTDVVGSTTLSVGELLSALVLERDSRTLFLIECSQP